MRPENEDRPKQAPFSTEHGISFPERTRRITTESQLPALPVREEKQLRVISEKLPDFTGENESVTEEIQDVQRYFLQERNILLVPVGGSVINVVGVDSTFSFPKQGELQITDAAFVSDKRSNGTVEDADAIAFPVTLSEDGEINIASYDEVMTRYGSPQGFIDAVDEIGNELAQRQSVARKEHKGHYGPTWEIEPAVYQETKDAEQVKRRSLKDRIGQFVTRFDVYSPDTDLQAEGVTTNSEARKDSRGHLVCAFDHIKREGSWNMLNFVTWQTNWADPKGDQKSASFISFSPQTLWNFYRVFRAPLVREKDWKKIHGQITKLVDDFKENNLLPGEVDFAPLRAFRNDLINDDNFWFRIKRSLLIFWWDSGLGEFASQGLLQRLSNKWTGV